MRKIEGKIHTRVMKYCAIKNMTFCYSLNLNVHYGSMSRTLMTIIDEIPLFQSILDSDERISIISAKRNKQIKMHMI